MNKIKWLITDFDRTLIQLFSDLDLKQLFKELKVVYLENGVNENYLVPMNDPYEMWVATYKYLQKQFNPLKAKEIHSIATSVITKFEINASKNAILLPNVVNTLLWLKKMNINCAIVSTNSTEAIKLILERNNLSVIITQVFGRDDNIPMEELKPSPTLIHRAISTLKANPKHSIYIGDSKDDMIAGNSAGIPVIGVLTGKTSANELLLSGAHIILSNFSSLQEFDHLF